VPVVVNAMVAKVQPAKHAPTVAPASPAAQNAVVAKVEHPKTAPAVEPVIPVAEHHSVAKVQTSTHAAPVAQVAPVTPVAQVAPVKPNAPIATVEHNTPSPAIAAVRPVAPENPVAEISNAASVQTSAHLPAAVPGNPVRANAVIANAVVAKTERKQPVPPPAHIAPVRPAAEVNVAAKVVQSEHVAAVKQVTPPVAAHAIVPVAEKTAVVTTVAAQPESGLETGDRVQVRKGDSLWKLAEEHLGNGTRWPELARLNPEIEDPNLVRIGEWVRVPDEKREAAEHKVVVQPGDTLSKVAQAEFGNARAFTCIAEANPALQAVDRIYPGETLVLPPTCNVTR